MGGQSAGRFQRQQLGRPWRQPLLIAAIALASPQATAELEGVHRQRG